MLLRGVSARASVTEKRLGARDELHFRNESALLSQTEADAADDDAFSFADLVNRFRGTLQTLGAVALRFGNGIDGRLFLSGTLRHLARDPEPERRIACRL